MKDDVIIIYPNGELIVALYQSIIDIFVELFIKVKSWIRPCNQQLFPYKKWITQIRCNNLWVKAKTKDQNVKCKMRGGSRFTFYISHLPSYPEPESNRYELSLIGF